MVELLKHPTAMKKVQEELQRVVGSNNQVEEFHLSQLTYLDAVMKETFRLNPPGPLGGSRCSSQSTSIGGYKIPKGTKIIINMWAIQRDPNIWENPLEFKPERFLAKKFDFKGNDLSFFPFGSGRRICPGITLADRMSKYMVASLLHLFDWKLPAGANMEFSEQFGFGISLKEAVVGIPIPRFSNSELYL